MNAGANLSWGRRAWWENPYTKFVHKSANGYKKCGRKAAPKQIKDLAPLGRVRAGTRVFTAHFPIARMTLVNANYICNIRVSTIFSVSKLGEPE